MEILYTFALALQNKPLGKLLKAVKKELLLRHRLKTKGTKEKVLFT